MQAATGATAIPNGTVMVRTWLATARQRRALGAFVGMGLVLLVAGTVAGTVWRVPGVSWSVAIGSGIVALAAGTA